MTQLSIQKELVDDRRRNLAAPRHGSARPDRLEAQRPAQSETRRWRAFSLLVVAYFMTIVDLTVVNVALPTIGLKLHFPESDLQWVVTAYGLTFGGFLLLGGRAADLLGRRRLLLVGLAIFTVGVADVRSGHLRHVPHRHARGPGFRGSDHPARRPLDRDEHVPRRSRAQQGPGHLGRHGRHGRDDRGARRWPAHPLHGLAVHLLPQRADRRGRACPRPEDRAREPAATASGGATTPSEPSPSRPDWWSWSTPSPRRRRWAGPPPRPWPCSPRRRLCSSRSSSSRPGSRHPCCP